MTEPYHNSGYHEDLHQVTISHDFEIQITDVTQEQWVQIMGSNPSSFQNQNFCKDEFAIINNVNMCAHNPVENVSWADTQIFIQKLNSLNDGYTYRLPSEAEWEYSARAGTQTAYYFGKDASLVDDYVWYSNNGKDVTHPVATKKPNAFGLYDMSGNVFQWTQDTINDYARWPVTDPVATGGGDMTLPHMVRGGCFTWLCHSYDTIRVAHRGYDKYDFRGDYVGFRLVRTKKVP